MLRLMRIGWIVVVVGGGLVLAVAALAMNDPGGAAVLAGIALLGGLASLLLPEGTARRKSRGFQPGRRR